MTATGTDWTPTRRAEAMHQRRDELIARLPRVHPSARSLTPDERALAVDDAIELIVLRYAKPIHTSEELERVFWTVAGHKAHEVSRKRTVRNGYHRADDSVLDRIADDARRPEAIVEQTEEHELAAEFAATLTLEEGRVYAVKFLSDTVDPLGYRKVAERLSITPAQARALERSIGRKVENFAAAIAAGKLCEQRAGLLANTATGRASALQARIAKAHIKHCAACKLAYTAQLHDLRSAEFARKVASLLPGPTAVEVADRHRSARELLADLIARLLGHGDTSATAAQLVAGGAGRGAGTALAAKLAACLAGGAATIGACVATGLVSLPTHPVNSAPPKATPAPTVTHARGRTAAAVRTPNPAATPRATPTPKPQRPARTTRRSIPAKTQGGTSPTSHEQTTASAAPAGALPNGGSEFVPSAATHSAPPAPVPAAPGANEFGP